MFPVITRQRKKPILTFGAFSTTAYVSVKLTRLDTIKGKPGMFIQVPESVSKSLKKGHVPKTQIHYPKSSFQNQDPASAVWVDNVGIHESRNVFTGRFECSCTTTVPTVGPGWIPWSSAMIPTHEQHRMCRELYSNLPVVLSPHGSPSRQGVVELKMQNGEATVEEVSVVKQDQHIEDDIESIESPRSFASSGSTSSREDTLINLTPELLCSAPGPASPVPKPRSQQANPWGKASYSDLITMAITSREDNMMTLSDIYSWIVKNVPYFNDKGTYLSVQGWKVSQRQ